MPKTTRARDSITADQADLLMSQLTCSTGRLIISAFGIIKAVPLHELLTYDKGVLDPTRDADQLLYDFLVAVFDDSSFVRDHYDDLDADTIDRIVKIFGRINHIDEKEEAARKNREAQAQAKR
jgi:hypothetical protein